MSLCAWTDFLDEVMVDVPGCQVPVAVNAIKNSVQWLAKESKILVQPCALLSTTAGQASYTFAAPSADVMVFAPEKVFYQGNQLDPISEEGADKDFPQWRTETGDVYYWMGTAPDTVRLIRTPALTAANSLLINAAVIPARTAAGPDALFLSHFREEIAAGAKARLMLQPKKPYTNPSEAIYFDGLFKAAVGKASVLKATGFGKARIRTTSYAR